jgi:hypothetical protein
MASLKLKPVMNIATVNHKSRIGYEAYRTSMFYGRPLNIYDYPNIKDYTGGDINTFIESLHLKEIREFHIIVTNTTVTPGLADQLDDNIMLIIVKPGREIDDAVCVDLAARYIEDKYYSVKPPDVFDINNAIIGLRIYTQDNYTSIQHEYGIPNRTGELVSIGSISLVDLYKQLTSPTSTREQFITPSIVMNITKTLVNHSSAVRPNMDPSLIERRRMLSEAEAPPTREELAARRQEAQEAQRQRQAYEIHEAERQRQAFQMQEAQRQAFQMQEAQRQRQAYGNFEGEYQTSRQLADIKKGIDNSKDNMSDKKYLKYKIKYFNLKNKLG